ncbi:1-acyl-sn-glycerol-3-phosphate acyltransferase [Myxococcota bacterium]|nr:1-acyl-sn-glycerol-3-phosphate acyltransferase [Myxococcota bacterium]
MHPAQPRTLAQRGLYAFCWVFCFLVCLLLFRLRAKGAERLPKDGPFLLLGNHTSALDPVWAGIRVPRHLNFMASEALFRVPILGWLIRNLGAFPKQKFVRDDTSMETLARLYAAGNVIVMFPEGTRTWDGRSAPVRAGIGALIKRLNARVVFVRNKTGFLVQPRWAPYPRFVPVEVEYSEPFTFPESMSVEEIAEVVRAQIRVDPEVRARRPAFGRRRAVGLPDYLWACPRCFTLGGLQVNPDHMSQARCGRCGGAWLVTVDARLKDLKTGEEQPIARAFDAIEAHFGTPAVVDRARLDTDGVLLRAERATLTRLVNGQKRPEPVAEGEAVLTPTRLSIRDAAGAERWGVELGALRAVSVEIGNQLRLLPPNETLVLSPAGQSTLLWSHVLRGWLHHVRGGVGEAPPG